MKKNISPYIVIQYINENGSFEYHAIGHLSMEQYNDLKQQEIPIINEVCEFDNEDEYFEFLDIKRKKPELFN
jgi:abortive infection bacteriophage resistance protein